MVFCLIFSTFAAEIDQPLFLMRQKFVFTLIALLTTTMVWAASGNYGTWLVFATPNSSVINVVRDHIGLSLKEAKELVDKAPCYVLQNITLEEAQTLANALNDAGATARVVDMTTGRYFKQPSEEKSCYFDVNGAYFGPEEEYLKGAGSYQYHGAYFTGDYPTPGGNRVVNRALVNYVENINTRAY